MANATPLAAAALLTGLAGLALGLVAVLGQAPADAETAVAGASEEHTAELRLGELDLQGREFRKQLERLKGQVQDRDGRILALERRVEQLAAAGPATAAPPDESAAEDAAEAASAAEFKDLQAKVFAGEANADQLARFWELARTTGALDDMLGRLEGVVQESPDDLEARMNLAQGYVAKLLTVPNGPERGAWAIKAEGQWAKILDVDANHWDARYSLGISWSQWPDFFNKTPDAVKQFETLRDVQERGAAEPRHAQTYLHLSRLHLKLGNAENSREALEAGSARHPEDEGLQKALDAIGD